MSISRSSWVKNCSNLISSLHFSFDTPITYIPLLVGSILRTFGQIRVRHQAYSANRQQQGHNALASLYSFVVSVSWAVTGSISSIFNHISCLASFSEDSTR